MTGVPHAGYLILLLLAGALLAAVAFRDQAR